jgi:DNA-binding NarL/FixJ family response regulator
MRNGRVTFITVAPNNSDALSWRARQTVGEAESAEHSISMLEEYRPDLVILPLRLEGELKGVELCREVKSSSHSPRVLIYTSYNTREDASSSFLSGADSFVHKGEDTGRLLDTIRATAEGRRVWLLGPVPPRSKPV